MKSIGNSRPNLDMKNRKNKSKPNTLDSLIHHNFLNMNKQLSRRNAILLDSGYYDTETWGDYENVGQDLESQR
jgi:hypothetical protein